MIGSKFKPLEEIMESLKGHEKVAIVGCGGCAATCKTGDEGAVKWLADRVGEAGHEVTLEAIPQRTCNIKFSREALDDKQDVLKSSDAVIVMGCGGATQVVRQLTEEYGLHKEVMTALDSTGHMDTVVAGELAIEQCQECGQCVLNMTGGICPVTKCAKGLLNGPCGGSQDGKCEVDPEKDCAWILIFRRMQALGRVDDLKNYMEPKDWSLAGKPRKVRLDKPQYPEKKDAA